MKILSRQKIEKQAQAYLESIPNLLGPEWKANFEQAQIEHKRASQVFERKVRSKCAKSLDDSKDCNCESLPGYTELVPVVETAARKVNALSRELYDAQCKVRREYIERAVQVQAFKTSYLQRT